MPAVTLATWNLRRPAAQPNARSSTLRRHIDRAAADVWVLTETHDSITPGDGYAAVSTTGADRAHWPGERWVTIWSRLPIERLGETGDPTRAVVARVRVGVDESTSPATSAGRGLIIYGTVLPWIGSVWRDIPWRDGAFAAALEAQAADWRALRAAYPADDLFVSITVVTGELRGADPRSEAARLSPASSDRKTSAGPAATAAVCAGSRSPRSPARARSTPARSPRAAAVPSR